MSEPEVSLPVFRPPKRRKLYRPRRASASPDIEQLHTGFHSSEIDKETHDDSIGTSHSDNVLKTALRARKLKTCNKGGIPSKLTTETSETVQALIVPNSQSEAAREEQGGIFAHRFVKPTGVVEDVMDKAMAAYVDSRIDALKSIDLPHHEQQSTSQSHSQRSEQTKSATTNFGASSQLATTAGKIQEIDLGPSSRHANMLQTTAALEHGNVSQDGTIGRNGKKQKRRTGLGPDGKPWRNKRNRRTSEDIKRDALVESIMAESLGRTPLNPNDASMGKGPTAVVNDDAEGQDADESMLLAFQKEYYDAQQSRQARKPPPLAGKEKEADAKSKGPRLGGSRSARAAMHKSLQDAELKKKGK